MRAAAAAVCAVACGVVAVQRWAGSGIGAWRVWSWPGFASLNSGWRGRPDWVHIVHQQYRTRERSLWPPEWRMLSSIWRQSHPAWEHWFWTDDDEARLFREQLPEFEELYTALPTCRGAKIAQADLSSYAIMYLFGGVYAELDTAPLLNLDGVISSAMQLAGGHAVMLFNVARVDADGVDEPRGAGGLENPYSMDNDLMVSTAPRQAFFYALLESIKDFFGAHNKTVCHTRLKTPTYDLMHLTAWGRLGMCARAWSGGSMDALGLRFLESLYLRDREDASIVSLAMHALPNLSLAQLQAHPPPTRLGSLGRWAQKALELQRRDVSSDAGATWAELAPDGHGPLTVLLRRPDLLILPAAASPPSLPKHALRQLLVQCAALQGDGASQTCFMEAVRRRLSVDFPSRDARANLAVVFNSDDGIWEGSWSRQKQLEFAELVEASGFGVGVT